mmetsp:Transcript_5597/g.16999  ORF Transcript_5597/g.16999 Transcript_5597/m.16999 type:complete len:149 (-) Transcript_5597:969-1415(-)
MPNCIAYHSLPIVLHCHVLAIALRCNSSSITRPSDVQAQPKRLPNHPCNLLPHCCPLVAVAQTAGRLPDKLLREGPLAFPAVDELTETQLKAPNQAVPATIGRLLSSDAHFNATVRRLRHIEAHGATEAVQPPTSDWRSFDGSELVSA